MARFGVTYQDIANAANQILAQGRQPTIELIRQFLGTGSTTTIANHLRQWRADQGGALSYTTNESVPQEMMGMVKGLWERLSVQADQKAHEIEAKTQKEIIELKQELEKYKINNRRWQQLFNQWQQEKEQLVSDKLRLQMGHETQQNEIDVLNAKLEAQEFQANEKKLHIEDLHRMQQQIQANLEHYRESTREQRLVEQAQFEQQKQEMQHKIKVLKEQLELTKNKVLSTQQEYILLQQVYHQLEDVKSNLEIKHDNQSQQINELQASRDSYQQLSQHWERQYQAINSQLMDVFSENKILSQQLQESRSSLKIQHEDNKRLLQEKWLLAQEKSQLEGQLKQAREAIA